MPCLILRILQILRPQSRTLPALTRSGGPPHSIHSNLFNVNPDIRVLVSVGGPGGLDSDYSRLVLNEQSVVGFANATVTFLNAYNLDGAELSWPNLQSEQVSGGRAGPQANIA